MEKQKIGFGMLVLISVIVCAVLMPNSMVSAQDAEPALKAVETEEPTLEQIRQAAEKYRDVNVALAEGYIPDPMNMCETAESMGLPADKGAMGVHYFRPDLLGITATEPRVNGTGIHTDFNRPAILLYEPQADGSMELVGVENLVFAEAWYAAGNEAPPSFHGVTYDHMVDNPETELDEAHMFEEHYDRHVWVFRENPAGVFEPFNPNVTCEHHQVQMVMDDH